MSQQIRTRKHETDTGHVRPARSVLLAAAPDPADESTKLGRRIRELRLKADLTLADLARATGVSIGTLSQLERGLVSPTVRTLFTVGNALGVAPAWLIDPGRGGGHDNASQFIVRANQRARFVDSGGVRKDIASPAANERLTGFLMVIEPGCGSGAEPYTHAGDEIGLILSGTLELRIEDAIFALGEGDCFCFSSDRPHQFRNVGARPSSVFWVNART
jgi:transcriptional regulator with XRE-family HTH domain